MAADATTDTPVEASAVYWDRANLAPVEDVKYWLGVLSVRREINRRMTGDPDTLYIQAFLDSIRHAWPVMRALSVGCGAGELERGVAELGAAGLVEGVDVSEKSLATARQLAGEAGLADRITYHCVEASSFLRQAVASGTRYDLLFFHGSLHHLENLEAVLDLSAEVLRGGRPGLLYVDEYVGPSRSEWTSEHLAAASRLFMRIPVEARRTPDVWPPIAMEDPTEMIRSSSILPILRERFEIVDEKPYYGNILAPLVCAIRGSATERPEVQSVLAEAVAEEESLAREASVSPLYVALVARPR